MCSPSGVVIGAVSRCLWWIPANAVQHAAFQDPVSSVQPEGSNCGFTDWRSRFNHDAAQPKVIGPTIVARIEQSDKLTGTRCDGANIGPLGTIAESAGKRQIL
jgi:hypothetical protein